MGLFFLRDPGLSCPLLAAALLWGYWSFGSRDSCELPGTSSPHSEKQAGGREKKQMNETVRLFSLSLRKSFPGSSSDQFLLALIGQSWVRWLLQASWESGEGSNFSWVPWYSPSPRAGVLLLQKKVIAILGMDLAVLSQPPCMTHGVFPGSLLVSTHVHLLCLPDF